MKKVLSILIVLTSLLAQDEFSLSKATVGGYGELHINSVSKDNSPTKTTADFHRFVLFFGYSFSDSWSFKSEVELEHNMVGKKYGGELELEQAYIDYHHSNQFGFRAGVLLAPVGYINEFHEPPTFLGVERPTFDKYILPTTWFDNGISVYGVINKSFAYNVTMLGSLNGNKMATDGIRSGRAKGEKSALGGYNFNNPTFILRADYVGFEGANVGFSYTTNNAIRYSVDGDGDFDSLLSGLSTSIIDLHAKYNKDNITAKVQYGQVSFDGLSYDGHTGLLVEAGYDVIDGEKSLIPFVRYEDLNRKAGVATQAEEDGSHYGILTVGASYKPLDKVVFKIDYSSSKTKEDDAKATSTIALGVGYMF